MEELKSREEECRAAHELVTFKLSILLKLCVLHKYFVVFKYSSVSTFDLLGPSQQTIFYQALYYAGKAQNNLNFVMWLQANGFTSCHETQL